MTKDGRPSRIADVRYFFGQPHTYLAGHREAWAYGSRMAMFLNGEGFSMGAHPALYILLDPTMEPGTARATDFGMEWWHRYAHAGVPPDLTARSDSTELVMDATVAALAATRPDLRQTVEDAALLVRANGISLRFLMRVQRSRRYLIERSFSIGVLERPRQSPASDQYRQHFYVGDGPRHWRIPGRTVLAAPIRPGIGFHAERAFPGLEDRS